MSFCIRREEGKPDTYCCGCSLFCGVVTVAVLNGIGLVSAIAGLNPIHIATNLFFTTPLICIFIWRDSRTCRNINFIWQCIAFVMMLVGLSGWVWAIDGMELPAMFCSSASMENMDEDNFEL